MLGGCWFTTLGKDLRLAWRLLVYYLREGFKAHLEAAGLLPWDGFKACLLP